MSVGKRCQHKNAPYLKELDVYHCKDCGEISVTDPGPCDYEYGDFYEPINPPRNLSEEFDKWCQETKPRKRAPEAPSNPEVGSICFDIAGDRLVTFDGTRWVEVAR